MRRLAIALLLVAACKRPEWVEHCEANGGHVVKYDCRTHQIPITTYIMIGKVMVPLVSMHTVTECSERCEGATPEAVSRD